MRPALYTETLRLMIDPATRRQIIALARNEGLDTSSFVRRELRRIARDAVQDRPAPAEKDRASG